MVAAGAAGQAKGRDVPAGRVPFFGGRLRKRSPIERISGVSNLAAALRSMGERTPRLPRAALGTGAREPGL
jgi:hypothetical protein